MVSCSYGSHSITFGLNHKYENKTIECYNIECGKWTDTLDRVGSVLETNGIDDNDRTTFRRFLNQHSKKIANHFQEQRRIRLTAAQKAREQRIDLLKHSPPIELSIKDVLRMHEGNFRVRGMINGLGDVEKVCIALGFRCEFCGEINTRVDYRERPRFAYETPPMDPRNMMMMKDRFIMKSGLIMLMRRE